MGIIDRVAQLVLANINDLLDQAEDPEKILNQVLREMEAQRRQAREALIGMVAQEKLNEADWTQHEKAAAEWHAKAVHAKAVGKDDLARESLRRKRSSDELATLYQAQLTSQRQAVSQMKAQLHALDAKYHRTMSQRDLLIARQRRARAQETVARSLSAFAPLDPAAELERMERKIRMREAHVAALGEGERYSIDAQLHELEYDLDVETELALLKGPTGALPAIGLESSGGKS